MLAGSAEPVHILHVLDDSIEREQSVELGYGSPMTLPIRLGYGQCSVDHVEQWPEGFVVDSVRKNRTDQEATAEGKQ